MKFQTNFCIIELIMSGIWITDERFNSWIWNLFEGSKRYLLEEL